jgi:hypothetical protein
MKDLKIQVQTQEIDMNTIKKIATAITLFCTVSCINRAEPEMHVLPKGFQGYVIIVFNDPNGQDEKYEDGFRVYEIPSNGILRTKFEFQDGWIANGKLKYYYNSSGVKEEINYINLEKEAKDSSANYIHGKELSKGCVRYIVSPLKKGDTYFEEMHKKLDELFLPIVQ